MHAIIRYRLLLIRVTMDVQKILQGNKQDLLNEIDKKVHLKTYKEGNKQKTCLSGLEDFISATEKKTQNENNPTFHLL